jgi:hypothetical protein
MLERRLKFKFVRRVKAVFWSEAFDRGEQKTLERQGQVCQEAPRSVLR